MKLEFINQFGFIDILVLLLLIRTAYVGFKRGLIGELIITGGLLILSFFSFRYYKNISPALNSFLSIPAGCVDLISFILIIIAGILILWLCSKIATVFVEIIMFKTFNKILGIFLGLIKGLVIASILLYAVSLPCIGFVSEQIQKSFSGTAVLRFAPVIADKTSGFINWIF